MDNMYPPHDGMYPAHDGMYPAHDGDSRDWPTEQLSPMAGQQGHAEPGGPAGSGNPAGARTPRRRLRRGVAAAAATALLCGGAVAGVALAGGASPPPSGPTGQAAVLGAMLGSASSDASAATALAATAPAVPRAAAPAAARCRGAARRQLAGGRPRAARAALRACRHRLRRLRRLGVLAGIHGQFTFETKSGPRTLAFERGVVESVSPAAVVVRAQDGTTWTWDLVSNTVIRQNAQRAARSALSAGQHVFVGGPVTGAANDARLIVIRAAGASASS